MYSYMFARMTMLLGISMAVLRSGQKKTGLGILCLWP